MSRLSEKVAIVTGASKGTGAGIATALGASGARVAVTYSSDRGGAERVAQAITAFRISSMRNKSVSSARRWIDAFRLSIN